LQLSFSIDNDTSYTSNNKRRKEKEERIRKAKSFCCLAGSFPFASTNARHEKDNILCVTENLLIKTFLLVNLHEFEF
jgi:hypothetical protein